MVFMINKEYFYLKNFPFRKCDKPYPKLFCVKIKTWESFLRQAPQSFPGLKQGQIPGVYNKRPNPFNQWLLTIWRILKLSN